MGLVLVHDRHLKASIGHEFGTVLDMALVQWGLTQGRGGVESAKHDELAIRVKNHWQVPRLNRYRAM